MLLSDLTVRTQGGFVIIEPGAAIRSCEHQLLALVSAYLDKGFLWFILNLTDVHYVDSASLGAIVQSFGLVTRRGGRFVLCSCVQRLIDLLETTKLHNVFEVFDSESDAMRSFR